MENAISTNNVKPILSYKEKSRFHQISGQFFKGSHEFFVEQQLKTQKFIDEKLKNSSFYEHYQDAIQDVRENIKEKVDDIKNNTKRDFYQKLMDFIIIFEIGVIAATQCPFKLEGVSKFITDTKNQLQMFGHILGRGWDGVLYVMDQCGQKLNFSSFVDSAMNGITSLMRSALGMFSVGIDYFFNELDNNAFLICLGECAAKVGESASGAVGIILDLVLAAADRSVAKRPDLTHFLKYGTNPYMIASQIEKDAHQIVGIHEKLSFSSDEIGYSWNGIWYGVVNENDDDDKDELDDAKRVLNDLRELRVKASKESADTYSSGSYHSGSSILNTESYTRMVKMWEKERNVSYDLSGTSTQYMGHLQINEKHADVAFLKSQKDTIKKFYNTYKESDNPVARKICEEIDKWLFVDIGLPSKEFMGQRLRGYWPVRLFVFAPAILYAIIEFEHMQKMTKQMYQDADMRLNDLEMSQVIMKETEALSKFRDVTRLHEIGAIKTQDFIIKLNQIFTEAWYFNSFELLGQMRPDVILTSFKYFPQMVNLMTRGMERITKSFKFYNPSSWGIETTYFVTESDVKQNQDVVDTEDKNTFLWRNKEMMVKSISENHKRKKIEVKRLFAQRLLLWDYIKTIVNDLQDKKLYDEVSDKIIHLS